ncbi:MAG: MFS transporter [Stenomitos rutilans HA7619-LM2]|nr:MFS transporter [Stenomitos rutilans HA7619-LM2]
MAIACGTTVANLYYNQPLLALIARNFQVTDQAAGFIPMATQVGYALGILLFVPLGDLLERRKLIVTMLGLTALALGLAAISLNLTSLTIASFAIGMSTIASHVMIPFAAQLTDPKERGRVIGTIMGGLLIGILAARVVSGFIGAALDWRAMYWIASGLTLALAVLLWRVLPQSQPALHLSYAKLMQSLFHIVREQPVLRDVAAIGALSFGAFSAFWSTLVFLLEQPPYHYGSALTGLFGLVGIVGAAAAPVVGRMADRKSPKLTATIGVIITTLSFVLFWVWGHVLWGLIVGVILLDLGVQTTQISNQAQVYSLPEDIHSRLNALYIMFYFVGGAIGSLLGAYSWSYGQWQGVCAVSLLLLTGALAVSWKGQ